MKAVICPFCGVVSDVPHETQQGCIDALQSEIAHTRRVLERTQPLASPSGTDDQDPHLP
jgi:hypothetical protein